MWKIKKLYEWLMNLFSLIVNFFVSVAYFTHIGFPLPLPDSVRVIAINIKEIEW